jgi:hypothetical protein
MQMEKDRVRVETNSLARNVLGESFVRRLRDVP